ncbi:MAG TPA: hypothetical protein DIT04_02350 [Dysgonomonas sp.]|nr:hypothetical protein [Dysgonomonas sp.]
MKEDNNILEQLPLLKQLSSEELEQFTRSYKSILTLAKIVLPLLIIAIFIIFIVYASKFSSFNPLKSDLIGYIILLCIGWFIIFVPIAFYKIYTLRSRVYKKGEEMGVDKGKLLDEFIIYLHAIISVHYGVNLK